MIPLDQKEASRRAALVDERCARVLLPPFWKRTELPAGAVEAMFAIVGVLDRATTHTIIVGVEPHDGVDWWHVSVAGRLHLPTWGLLMQAKDVFLGVETQAVQVLAPRSEHYNFHERCLHVWARVDGARVVPDFRRRLPDGTVVL